MCKCFRETLGIMTGSSAAVVGTVLASSAADKVPLPAARPAIKTIRVTDLIAPPAVPTRVQIRAIVEQEALQAGLPPDIAEAVVKVESSFDPTTIGSVGEIGLMQVRPGTAAMMGFRGSASDLARPDVNIHYGVTYLGKAWRLAGGDLCRALMKYRAGHGEEIMSALSVTYCSRARSYLAALGSPLAASTPDADAIPRATSAPSLSRSLPGNSASVVLKRGTPAASRAFWAAHETRVRTIRAAVRAKWSRVALR